LTAANAQMAEQKPIHRCHAFAVAAVFGESTRLNKTQPITNNTANNSQSQSTVGFSWMPRH
jgi:hypothetical protein